ncbi:hypothetical protein [Acinetobacter modestus]|uniref:hypothetical protein n=1 Tax=Acinetobacter modestus TaxID=1776740 RepID=UPI001F4B1D53|nr:hypothetical protein [Acinetobacter modestus]MCH7329631.1 hypothetical protein [Acinetobacter modestus]
MALFLGEGDKRGLFDEQFAADVENDLENFFDRILDYVNPKIEAYGLDEPDNDVFYEALVKLKENVINLRKELLKDIDKYKGYLTERILGTNYLDFSSDLKSDVRENNDFMNKINFYQLQTDQLYEYHRKWLDRIDYLYDQKRLRKELKEEVSNVVAVRLALEGHKTEEIYSEASNTFLSAARNYEVFFYMLIGAALIITVICLAYFPYSEATKVNFIFSKILTATLVITLGTLFLRKAAHLRKLHEQAHQTSLELQALPLFIKSLDKPDQDIIIKDLASKYFGKELDKTQLDKIGDLMSEQVKVSLEVFKTSSEIMKSMKSSEVKEKPKTE